MSETFTYLAMVQGGPEVWDTEITIRAPDFGAAAQQAIARAGEIGGVVVSVEQWEGIERLMTASRDAVERAEAPAREPGEARMHRAHRALQLHDLYGGELSLRACGCRVAMAVIRGSRWY